MKKLIRTAFFMGILLLAKTSYAQYTPQKEAKLQVEAEEGPMLFKFEPDYLAAVETRRSEILLMRAMIDSLDISEGKRQKLIRDLYKNNSSKKLNKILLANNKFEE
ncbi:hypothetical protein [uncultured Eudoraea sp.]|uniref:hypothetical protein n=1 Tax=uncultured Eudoraea sp. TaxID=1035614 RepID=UPI002637288A|nr:hypothetical protein [uncultured Eudoraea sp.]